jgi:hypothetical protein
MTPVPSTKRIADNPLVNPASKKPVTPLPAMARTQRATGEVEKEQAAWAQAKWTRATLTVRGTAKKSVTLASPSTLMVRASWKGAPDLAIAVSKDGSELAKASKAPPGPDGLTVATAEVRVPAAGEVVVQGTSGAAVKVDRYIGVIASAL